MANIIEIVLRAADKTKSGFTTPIRNLKDLEAAAEKLKPALTAVVATAGAALVALSKHAINSADEMGKLAQKAGTTVETFSGWAHVAGLANVEQEKLAKAFKETSKAIGEAETKGSPMNQLFEQMGVSTRGLAGEALTADKVLLQLADRFADSADGAGKVATAVKIFGDKLGQDMIPFLNQGASGIRDLLDEARELGQVIGTDTAAQAEQFNDNLTKMKAALQGVANIFIAEVLPALNACIGSFVKWVRESGVVRASAQTLIDVFKVLSYVVQLTMTAFAALSDLFVGIGNVIGSAAAAFVKFWETLGTGAGTAAAIIQEVISGNFSNAAAMAKGSVATMKAEFSGLGEAIKIIGKDAADGWNKALATMKAGPIAPDLSATVLDIDASTGSSAPEKPPMLFPDSGETGKHAEKIMAQLRAIADMRNQLNTQGMTGDALLIAQEQERYRKQLDQISQLKLEQEEYYVLTEQAERNHQIKLAQIHGEFIKRKLELEKQATEARKQMYADAMRAGSQAFGNLAEAARAFGKKGFAAMKAFAIAQTIIDTYQGAQAAYAAMARIPFVGPVLGVAAAGAAIAAGFARVASIRSMEPGVAHAGLGYVPEEATYVLQRGERVLAPRQNQDLEEFMQGGGGGGNSNVTLMIDGQVLGQVIGRLSRNGLLEIDSRAVMA